MSGRMVIRNAHIWVEGGRIRIEPYPDTDAGFMIEDSWIQNEDDSMPLVLIKGDLYDGR